VQGIKDLYKTIKDLYKTAHIQWPDMGSECIRTSRKWKRWLHCFHFAGRRDADCWLLRQNHRLVESQIANKQPPDTYDLDSHTERADWVTELGIARKSLPPGAWWEEATTDSERISHKLQDGLCSRQLPWFRD
jgi:hypothetical protein